VRVSRQPELPGTQTRRGVRRGPATSTSSMPRPCIPRPERTLAGVTARCSSARTGGRSGCALVMHYLDPRVARRAAERCRLPADRVVATRRPRARRRSGHPDPLAEALATGASETATSVSARPSRAGCRRRRRSCGCERGHDGRGGHSRILGVWAVRPERGSPTTDLDAPDGHQRRVDPAAHGSASAVSSPPTRGASTSRARGRGGARRAGVRRPTWT